MSLPAGSTSAVEIWTGGGAAVPGLSELAMDETCVYVPYFGRQLRLLRR
jgi:hypothetical protein